MRENLHSRRTASFVLAFLLFFCHVLDGRAQQPATYHAGVAEVRLVFSATKSNPETAITSLKPTDFVVIDDGSVVRSFSSFESSRVTNVQLAILVDRSESAGPDFTKEIAYLQRVLEHSTWISEENLSVRLFSDKGSTVLCDGDCRSPSTTRQISTTVPHGPTPLFDALVNLSGSLRHHPSGIKPAILLLSDGEDTISIHSFEDAIRTASSGEIQVFAIDLNRSAHSHGSSTLQGLATATGGRYFLPETDPAVVENVLLENLSIAYTLTYKPLQRRGQHAIRILPTHDLNLQFHCRSTYYADGTN
jgi:hypothetical protein